MFIEFDYNSISNIIEGFTKSTKPLWGNMTASEVIVHLQDTVIISLNRTKVELLTPEEKLPLYVKFLSSNQEMPKGYKVGFLVTNKASNDIEIEVILKNHNEILADFFKLKNDPDFSALHPIYGVLNYNQWVLLHQKHYTHHLKQFGLIKE